MCLWVSIDIPLSYLKEREQAPSTKSPLLQGMNSAPTGGRGRNKHLAPR